MTANLINASVTSTGIDAGVINTLGSISPAGTGYRNGTYVVPLTGGTGSLASAQITVAGNAVTVVTLLNGGVNYTAGDSLSMARLNAGGAIATLSGLSGGSGYTPGAGTATYNNVGLTSLGNGFGSGATANITVTNGAVTNVVLVLGGNGYTNNFPQDVLSANAADIGGTVSTAFTINVATITGTNFAVSVSTIKSVSGVTRTFGARIGDIYNVVDWGADPSNTNDSQPAIQAAVSAAMGSARTGGTIFFPPGIYKINNPIIFNHNSHASLRIVGCGGIDQFGGSILTTDQNIYIFQTDHGPGTDQGGGQPISSIENVTFANNFAGSSITSSEGANGCVYLTAGIGVRFQSCGFWVDNTGGIGLFSTALSIVVTNSQFSGPYGYTNAQRSYGAIIANGYIGDSKIGAFGVGVMCAWNGGGIIHINNMDIEVCGCAILLGETPIELWDNYSGRAYPAGSATSCSFARVSHINCESNGDTDASSIGAICKVSGGDIVIAPRG